MARVKSPNSIDKHVGMSRAYAPYDARHEPVGARRCARHHLPAGPEIREGHQPDQREPTAQVCHILQVSVAFFFEGLPQAPAVAGSKEPLTPSGSIYGLYGNARGVDARQSIHANHQRPGKTTDREPGRGNRRAPRLEFRLEWQRGLMLAVAPGAGRPIMGKHTSKRHARRGCRGRLPP